MWLNEMINHPPPPYTHTSTHFPGVEKKPGKCYFSKFWITGCQKIDNHAASLVAKINKEPLEKVTIGGETHDPHPKWTLWEIRYDTSSLLAHFDSIGKN